MRRILFVLLALVLGASRAPAAEAPLLAGTVTDLDGRPVASAVVGVVELAPGWRPWVSPGAKLPGSLLASATTDEAGAFAIDVSRIPAGFHALRLEIPGRAPLIRHDERVAFGAGTLPRDLRLVVPPAASVEGLALDATGRPAASLRITASASVAGHATLVTERTGSDGRFRIAGLPAGAEVVLVADAADGSMARAEVALPLAGSRRVALHLGAARPLAGRVVERAAEPRPVAGARVLVIWSAGIAPMAGFPGGLPEFLRGPRDGGSFVAGEGVTGADGSFAVTLPPSCTAYLAQPGFGYRPLSSGRNEVVREPALSGVVVDSAGKPVRDARVGFAGDPLVVTTDAAGAFTLPAASRSQLRVTSPSGAVLTVPFRKGTSRVTLPRARTLSLSVVTPPTEASAEGLPLAGATVRIAVGDDRDVVAATDASGRLQLTLPEPPQRVIVTSPVGAAAADVASVDFDKPVRLVAAPPLAVTARVTAAGKPLAGAVVALRGESRPRDLRLLRTNAEGIATSEAWPPGSVSVTVRADGFRTESAAGVPGAAARAIALQSAGRLRVSCRDAAGKPIEGVLVTARSPAERAEFPGRAGRGRGPRAEMMGALDMGSPATAGSGPDGIATFDGVTPGECLRLEARRPGLAPAEMECARPEAGAGGIAEIQMQRGATVRGRVLDPDGVPMAGATVTARGDSATASAAGGSPFAQLMQRAGGVASATTDAAGAFVLADLPPGRVELVARAPRFAESEMVPADLASGDDVETDLHLGVAATIEGVVTTASGDPAPGATVAGRPPGMVPRGGGPRGFMGQFGAATSGPDGRFVIEGLEPGAEMTIWASLEGEESERRVAKAGGDPVTLALVTLGTIDGRVLGLEDLGTGADVTCTGAPEGRSRATADAEGRFLMKGLPAGTYSCVAIAGDAGEGRAENLVVRVGEIASATIRLGPRTRQDVIVRDDASGEPIAGAGVRCGSGRAVTDAAGFASVAVAVDDESRARGIVVAAAADGYAPGEAKLASPPPAVLEIRLRSSAAIRGQVIDAAGAPVAGIDIRGAAMEGTSDADGRFELVPPRATPRVTLTAERTLDGVIERGTIDLDVPAAGLDGVVLRLERIGTGSLLVIASDDAGPVTGAQVAVVHESSPARRDVQVAGIQFVFGAGLGASGTTDGEGSFLAEDLRPGEFTILVGRAGEATLRAAGTARVASSSQATASVRVPGGRMVTGRVVRAGQPVEAASVTAVNAASGGGFGMPLAFAASAADGSFELGPFPEDLARVVVRAASSQPDDRDAEGEGVPGGAPIILDVAGSRFTGRVLADGEPANGAEVAARAEGRTAASARTAPDGTFTLAGLDPGVTYDVSARMDGRAPAATTATAPASGTAALPVLELRSEELIGTVSLPAGRMAESFVLFVARPDGSRLPPIQVDVKSDGTWRAGAPAGEPLAYRASAPGVASLWGTTEPGRPLALAFSSGAELTIQVTDARGAVAGAMARLVSWNGRPADDHLVPSRLSSARGGFDRSDERGELRLVALAAGTYEIAVVRDAAETRVTVALEEGARERVVARLP